MNPFCATTNPEFIGQYFKPRASKCGEWHFVTHLRNISSICLSNSLTALSSKWDDSGHFINQHHLCSWDTRIWQEQSQLGRELPGNGTSWNGRTSGRWPVLLLSCVMSLISSLHIQAFGSSSWKSVWVRSPFPWRDTDSSSGAGSALSVGGRGSRQMGFQFCIWIGKRAGCISKYMWFSWIFLVFSWSFYASTQVHSPFL